MTIDPLCFATRWRVTPAFSCGAPSAFTLKETRSLEKLASAPSAARLCSMADEGHSSSRSSVLSGKKELVFSKLFGNCSHCRTLIQDTSICDSHLGAVNVKGFGDREKLCWANCLGQTD